MAATSYQFRAAAFDRASPRRRASGLALTLAANLLLLLVLLGIGAVRIERRPGDGAIVVDMLPRSDDRQAAARKRERTPEPPREAARVVPPRPPHRMPVIKSPIPPKVPAPWIEMSKEDFAAADIAKLPKAAAGASASSGGAGDSEVVGSGPHGETLYAAEWARHPTNAELGGYLPAGAPDGFGIIACKTAPGNRVEDCVELDQGPRGSHLASAVRQAAWQFRVRPPRKNGQPMIGEWVSIRIDYTHVERD